MQSVSFDMFANVCGLFILWVKPVVCSTGKASSAVRGHVADSRQLFAPAMVSNKALVFYCGDLSGC
jgi:hypothetical protein